MQLRILPLALALFAAPFARACPYCGGKNKAAWLALEREPKASQLFPQAPVVEVNLEIAEITLAPAGRSVHALAINGSVPGPTLRFHEGDIARIHVHNALAEGETRSFYLAESGLEVEFNAEVQPAPTIAVVGTSAGPATGGTKVLITGADLEGATAVDFGGLGAGFEQVSETAVLATTPPSPRLAKVPSLPPLIKSALSRPTAAASK